MQESAPVSGRVLITGGTSGLGLELVRIFLDKGFEVAVTGRNLVNPDRYPDRFKFFKVDFCDLKQAAVTAGELISGPGFDIIINNAGVLSPPRLMMTKDGFEYTFQVNFLTHLLLNEIIICKGARDHNLTIASVTSPIYRITELPAVIPDYGRNYKPYKAYADSKLFLALMGGYLSGKYKTMNLTCISYDPGVFGSHIYRMQNPWFRAAYTVAAPFMRRPGNAAASLATILERKDLETGSVYDFRSRKKSLPEADSSVSEAFWDQCHSVIQQFL